MSYRPHREPRANSLRNIIKDGGFAPPGECWAWGHAKSSGGRGIVYVGGRNMSVPAYSYQCHVGEVPKGSRVYTTCGTSDCWNPAHLLLSERRQQPAGLKACAKCDRALPVANFHRDRRRSDGLYPWCKDCRRGYYLVEDALRTRRRSSEVISGKAEYNREYRRSQMDLSPAEYWERHIWNAYRLTTELYDAMLKAQGGGCAICGGGPPSGSRGVDYGRFYVDHDHACCPGRKSCGECVRGLLCRGCNAGIGHFGDDPSVMTAAIAYLRSGGKGTRLLDELDMACMMDAVSN